MPGWRETFRAGFRALPSGRGLRVGGAAALAFGSGWRCEALDDEAGGRRNADQVWADFAPAVSVGSLAVRYRVDPFLVCVKAAPAEAGPTQQVLLAGGGLSVLGAYTVFCLGQLKLLPHLRASLAFGASRGLLALLGWHANGRLSASAVHESAQRLLCMDDDGLGFLWRTALSCGGHWCPWATVQGLNLACAELPAEDGRRAQRLLSELVRERCEHAAPDLPVCHAAVQRVLAGAV